MMKKLDDENPKYRFPGERAREGSFMSFAKIDALLQPSIAWAAR